MHKQNEAWDRSLNKTQQRLENCPEDTPNLTGAWSSGGGELKIFRVCSNGMEITGFVWICCLSVREDINTPVRLFTVTG